MATQLVVLTFLACVIGALGQYMPGYKGPTTTYKAPTYPTNYKPTTRQYYTPTPTYTTKLAYTTTPSYPNKPTYPASPSYPTYTTTPAPSYTTKPTSPVYPAGSNYNPGYQASPQAAYPGNNYDEKKVDELDKLNARIEAALETLKFYEEDYQAAVARLSLQRRLLDEFNKLTLVSLRNTDEEQDEVIEGLLETADKAYDEIEKELYPVVHELTELNRNNTDAAALVGFEIATATARDTQQDGDIFRLYTLVQLWKKALLQVADNDFQVIYDAIGGFVSQRIRRTCEVGQVTLGANTRAIEYQFQLAFDEAPGISYGLCGFDFKHEEKKKNGQYNTQYNAQYNTPYNQQYGNSGGSYATSYQQEPNSLGLNILAFPTKTGVQFRLVERSFGPTSTESASVCFQACSTGPGRFTREKDYDD